MPEWLQWLMFGLVLTALAAIGLHSGWRRGNRK